MFTTDIDQINNALASSQPVYCRQIGGITWMRVTNDHWDFDLLEYWVGPDHPIQPASVDPDYPMHMRPKLREVLNAVRESRVINGPGELRAATIERRHYDDALANVRELLEALRPFAEPHAMGDNYVQFAPRLIRAARAAIAKVEGKPPVETGYSVHNGDCPYEHGGACTVPMKNQSKRTTVFSPCRNYRYTLWREWGTVKLRDLFSLPPPQQSTTAYAMFVGLNPSTADETNDDPTIRRCIDFATRWGFKALCMTNLFAFRSTDPRGMMRASRPIGPDNDAWLLGCAAGAGIIIAAWGKKGAFKGRAGDVVRMLPMMHYLRLNDDGSPEHPLYIPAITKPKPYAF